MKIKNFAPIEYITDFELTKHEGEHSSLNFTASISDVAAEKFLACTGKTISVTTDDNAPIFLGRVETVEVEKLIGAARVFVSCISLSVTADEDEKTRIFHNPDKKISDVLSTARLNLLPAELKVAKEFSALKYSPVILQNQETNFQFMSRLAKRFGKRFWILDTMNQASFFIDSCIEKSARKLGGNKILSISNAKVGKYFKFFVKSQSFLDIGQVVTIENIAGEFVIVGLSLRLEDTTYYFRYELEEHKITLPPLSNAPYLCKSAKFHAKVINTKDPKNLGRVQVLFDDKFIEDMDKKNPLWIDYRTPYAGKSGGVVFIPDEGDAVEVIFTNEEIFCVSAVRENPLDAECQNVKDKYIGNNFKQRMFFKEKSLEFFSDKYKIVMNEKGIEIVAGENSVTLNEQGIFLKTKAGKISMTKDISIDSDGKFAVKAKDTEIKTSGGIKLGGNDISVESSGAANVKAGGTLKLNGSKIALR